MTGGSPSRSNSESDELRLHNGPPNTSSEPASYGHSNHSRRGSSEDKELSQLVARGTNGGQQLMKPPGSLFRETVSTHARLIAWVGDIPTRPTTRTPRILAAPGFLTPYQHRARRGLQEQDCPSRVGLTFLYAVKKLTSPSLSLPNSDILLTAGIFL